MPLSEYEQRVLAQLEQELRSDPQLDRAMSRRSGSSKRLIVAVAGVVVGLTVMLIGVTANLPILGVVGFALMVGAALWALLGSSSAPVTKNADKSKPKQGSPTQGPSFMSRLEERFERRRGPDA